MNLKQVLKPTLMIILGFLSLLLVLSISLKGSPVNAQEILDPAEALSAIEDQIKPMLEHSTTWATEAATGITGLAALYALIVTLLKD